MPSRAKGRGSSPEEAGEDTSMVDAPQSVQATVEDEGMAPAEEMQDDEEEEEIQKVKLVSHRS